MWTAPSFSSTLVIDSETTTIATLATCDNPNQARVSEVDQPHRHGHIIPTEVVTKFLRDPQTGTLIVLGVSRDIATCRQAEVALIAGRNSLARRVEDLSRVNTELSRAVRAKDEILANMSHELRTPLNVILGISEILLEQLRGPLNERQQQSLHNIEISGRHLLTLINDILDLNWWADRWTLVQLPATMPRSEPSSPSI